MTLPDTLPCKCMNPNCGITFVARNPVGGGGTNISFSGNTTTCPRCGQIAPYADWDTDAQGNFHLRGFFAAVRNLQDTQKLKALKADLEAANDDMTAAELADTLVHLEPSFQEFKHALSSIPASAITAFINTLVALITLVIMYQTWQSTDEYNKDNLKILREQQSLAREQFEYQKSRDETEAETTSQAVLEREKIRLQIEALQRDFENRLQALEQQGQRTRKPSPPMNRSKLKGRLRNKPCACGSGKKAKYCHPNGRGI